MLKQRFLVDFGSKLVIYFLTALTGILVSRFAGPEVIGTVAFGLSFASLFYFMFGIFGTSHIKLISEGKDLDDCNKIYSTIIFLTCIVFVISVTCFYYIQTIVFNKSYTSIELTVITISIVAVCIQGLFKIPEITFTALLQQAKINLPKLIRTLVFNLGRASVVLFGLKAIALASVNLVANLFILPVYIYLMGNNFLKGRWDRILFRRYLNVAFPVLIITVCISIMGNYAEIMLKELSSNIELGYYFGATSLASMLILIGGTAGSLFFPLFSKAFANSDFNFIKQQISRFERLLFIFVLPIIIILSVNSETIIIFLLGDQYIASVSIFSVLIFYSFFKIWGIPYYNLMNGMNRFNLNAGSHVFFTILFFALLYFLIHPDLLNLGGLGLAYAILIINIVKLLIWFYYSNKIIKFRMDWGYLKIIVYAIVLYLAGIQSYKISVFDLNYFYKFGFIILYASIFYGGMYLLRLITIEDVTFLKEIVQYDKLIDYFRNEIKKEK